MTYKNIDSGRVVEHAGVLYRWRKRSNGGRFYMERLSDEEAVLFREYLAQGEADR